MIAIENIAETTRAPTNMLTHQAQPFSCQPWLRGAGWVSWWRYAQAPVQKSRVLQSKGCMQTTVKRVKTVKMLIKMMHSPLFVNCSDLPKGLDIETWKLFGWSCKHNYTLYIWSWQNSSQWVVFPNNLVMRLLWCKTWSVACMTSIVVYHLSCATTTFRLFCKWSVNVDCTNEFLKTSFTHFACVLDKQHGICVAIYIYQMC